MEMKRRIRMKRRIKTTKDRNEKGKSK